MAPIIDMQRRLHEAGRIRIGKQVPTGTKGKTRPSKLETFRFTTQSEPAAKMLLDLYGGELAIWTDAPAGKQWEVMSACSDLRVLVPPEQMSFSQHYELWKAGGCERRCDGREQSTGAACACDPEARECKPHTRLSVMLASLPTSGLWRLDTQGFYAMAELGGGFELAGLLQAATGRAVLGASLRLEQREVKRPGQGTRKFAVPVLDFDIDSQALVGERPPAMSPVTPVPLLPAPSLGDQLMAVNEEKPTRRRTAEPVRATGLKARPVSDAPPEELDQEQGIDVGESIRAISDALRALDGRERVQALRHMGYPLETAERPVVPTWLASQPLDVLHDACALLGVSLVPQGEVPAVAVDVGAPDSGVTIVDAPAPPSAASADAEADRVEDTPAPGAEGDEDILDAAVRANRKRKESAPADAVR